MVCVWQGYWQITSDAAGLWLHIEFSGRVWWWQNSPDVGHHVQLQEQDLAHGGLGRHLVGAHQHFQVFGTTRLSGEGEGGR